MARVVAVSLLLLQLAAGFRSKKSNQSYQTCAALGCAIDYDRALPCQCNEDCPRYKNCCSDFYSLCMGPSPSPSPSPGSGFTPSPSPTGVGAGPYWKGTNMKSMEAIKDRMEWDYKKLSYGMLWTSYKSVWVNLPGKCQSSMFDVYSAKCWTPGSSQCGSYTREGSCYNREHSWPKSWWNRLKNAAYSDMFHVMPSDGYVNGKRGSWPFGEVGKASYVSSEGNKLGSCSTPGYQGSCFEPIDSIKGLMARGHLYMQVRYADELKCCDKWSVDGAVMKPWYLALMLKWHAQFPPEEWEQVLNDRIQSWQGNRNPFIDFPELAQKLFV